MTFVRQTAVSACRTYKLDTGVDDIDAELLSHLHADHLGWRLPTPRRVPNSHSRVQSMYCTAFLDYVFGRVVPTGSTRHLARLD